MRPTPKLAPRGLPDARALRVRFSHASVGLADEAHSSQRMSRAAPSRTIPSGPTTLADGAAGPSVNWPEFVLPVLRRSAVLMNPLLQDSAIDVELASSVVGLDPGLAFGTLQLANPACGDPGTPIWQLPLAVVAAGREALQQLVDGAPRIEPPSSSHEYAQLTQLASNAVVRACVAHLMASNLGHCHPKKSFLGGLLFDLPELANLTLHYGDSCKVKLLSTMCRSLPAALVKATMGDPGDENSAADPVVATIFLADALLREKTLHPLTPSLEKLAAAPQWSCWPDFDVEQRSSLLQCCSELAEWANTRALQLDPWEFMSRLECHGPWK